MKVLNGWDAVSGKEGRAYAKIDGNNEELFYAKTIEAKVEKTKSQVKSIGRRMGTGSMTIYYITPLFRAKLAEWKATGRDAYFDLVIENDDPDSSAGRQIIRLEGVNLDATVLAKLDGDSDDPLEEETDFTFEDWDILTPFSKV